MTFVPSSSVNGTDGFLVSAATDDTTATDGAAVTDETAATDGAAATEGAAATDDVTVTDDVSFDDVSVDGVFAGDGDSFGGVSFVVGGGLASFCGIGSSKHGSKDDDEIFLVLSLFGISSFFGFSSFLIVVSFLVDSS